MTTTTWWKRISSIPGIDDPLKGTKKTAGRAGISSFAPVVFLSFFCLVQATHLNKQPKWIIISLGKQTSKMNKHVLKTCIYKQVVCWSPNHLPPTTFPRSFVSLPIFVPSVGSAPGASPRWDCAVRWGSRPPGHERRAGRRRVVGDGGGSYQGLNVSSWW